MNAPLEEQIKVYKQLFFASLILIAFIGAHTIYTRITINSNNEIAAGDYITVTACEDILMSNGIQVEGREPIDILTTTANSLNNSLNLSRE